jgi:hypothetical protein
MLIYQNEFLNKCYLSSLSRYVNTDAFVLSIHPCSVLHKIYQDAGCQWLIPVILATQEAGIKKITVQSQPGQIVQETLSRKKSITKKG